MKAVQEKWENLRGNLAEINADDSEESEQNYMWHRMRLSTDGRTTLASEFIEFHLWRMMCARERERREEEEHIKNQIGENIMKID